MSTYNKTTALAVLVREHRHHKGLSMMHAAELCTGVSHQTLFRIEHADGEGIREVTLRSIAQGLNMRVTDLLIAAQRDESVVVPFELPRRFDHMSPDDRKALIKFGDQLMKSG